MIPSPLSRPTGYGRGRLAGLFILFLFGHTKMLGQPAAPSWSVRVDPVPAAGTLFRGDPVWRGADGAASVDLGEGRVLWLFSDTFISPDSSGTRRGAALIRNSLAIQRGYAFDTASVAFYFGGTPQRPRSFFPERRRFWYWTGHGIRIGDRLLIFLMKIRGVKTGLGFEPYDWQAVRVDNPDEAPDRWRLQYLKRPDTGGALAGSSAVLSDGQYLYAYAAQEPATHEIYLLRWPLTDAYRGRLTRPEWWTGKHWAQRKRNDPATPPLFIGQTEFSVHYDYRQQKFIQVQSFGFGDSRIGWRIADRPEGPWSEPQLIYYPPEGRLPDRLLYSAKAHPELAGEGLLISYNVNSLRWEELLEDQRIYFPFFIRVAW